MAKVVITNLGALVDTAVTTNVNVLAANQAVDTATAKALEALEYAANAETSANTALGHVSTVQASAGAAASSALEAQGYSDAAQASAVASSGSAVEAAASAVAAEEDRQAGLLLLAQMVSTYDQFNDKYLGDHLMDPILDNDGQAIQEGALYWNGTKKAVKVYNQSGQIWTDIRDANGSLLLEHNLADLPDKASARTNLDVYSTEEVDALVTANDEASEISVAPQGNLSSTTVQSALEELQSDINSMLVDVEW